MSKYLGRSLALASLAVVLCACPVGGFNVGAGGSGADADRGTCNAGDDVCNSAREHAGSPAMATGGVGAAGRPSAVARVTAGSIASAWDVAGSGGAPAPAPVRIPEVPREPATTTLIHLQSDAGDWVGDGKTYEYTHATATIAVSGSSSSVRVQIEGDESWRGEFVARHAFVLGQREEGERLLAGPGFDWSGEGRGCNELSGWYVVDDIAFEHGVLSALDMRFEQHCEKGSAALRGEIHFDVHDGTPPTGPTQDVPNELWRAASDAVPASGNYAYLESDSGDFLGAGRRYLYTVADADFDIRSSGRGLWIGIQAATAFTGQFVAMQGVSPIQPGYYPDLHQSNEVKGWQQWSSTGKGCSQSLGWVVVDAIRFDGAVLSAIDLRFEHVCDRSSGALHGQIHWDARNPSVPPGPVNPPPAELWRAAAHSTPATGNYVYLESDAGDPRGGGRSFSYDVQNSVTSLSTWGRTLSVVVDGDEGWVGSFDAGRGQDTLSVGYYGELTHAGGYARGFSWSGDDCLTCQSWTGWFVVDAIAFDGAALRELDLRFEQHCDGGAPALRGQIHWRASNPDSPPGPVNPAPDGVWRPQPGTTPGSGSYLYLQSDAGDAIGAGQTYTYTPDDAVFSVRTWQWSPSVLIALWGEQDWQGEFLPMQGFQRMAPGYYGGVPGQPGRNPAKGGLHWAGEGRNCYGLSGWFAVDAIAWQGDVLSRLDLRFEQTCEGAGGALRGQLHWDARDIPAPAPVNPIPQGLWQPALDFTPPAGSWVHLESDAGEYIGAGQTRTYAAPDFGVSVQSTKPALRVEIQSSAHYARGDFIAMQGVDSLALGYYRHAQRYSFHETMLPGMDWSMDGRGCTQLAGWFAIDRVTYTGDVLTALDLRFEQHCDGGAALHGKVHYEAP